MKQYKNIMAEYNQYKYLLKILNKCGYFDGVKDKHSKLMDLFCCNDFQLRLNIFKIYFPYIGEGSSRYVLDCGDVIIKVAINFNGVIQNINEHSFYVNNPKYKKSLAKPLEIEKYGRWVICEKCELLDTHQFKELTNIPFDYWYSSIRMLDKLQKFNKTNEDIKNNVLLYLNGLSKSNKHLKGIVNLLQDDDVVLFLDLSNIESYGIDKKGNLVILDYGLDNINYINYFDSL